MGRLEKTIWKQFNLPKDIAEVVQQSPKVVVASTLKDLFSISTGDTNTSNFEVGYDVPGRGWYEEADVSQVRNDIVADYTEVYMRRRDSESLVVGDDQETDKITLRDIYGCGFVAPRNHPFPLRTNSTGADASAGYTMHNVHIEGRSYLSGFCRWQRSPKWG